VVVILDLGDGLDEAEQTLYDTTAAMIAAEPDTLIVWTGKDAVPEGRDPLPLGVIAWVKPDTDAPNPRKDSDCHIARMSNAAARDRVNLNECGHLDEIARNYTRAFVESNLRQMVEGVAAFSYGFIGDGLHYGYVTRQAVMATLPTPITPEQVEEFLALDVEKRAAEILSDEFREYEQWATGEVYAVHVTNVLNGKDAALHGCYDDSASHEYLRTVVDEIVGQVA
jgi:hypothetical protein